MLTGKLIFAAMFVLMLMAGAVQAGGDSARGQELSVDCADCHGEDGKGDEDNPAIAGLDETEHLNMLKAYKSGERVDEEEVMLMFTEELSEQDMADLAAYYATLAN
jgi:cytochrome c553